MTGQPPRRVTVALGDRAYDVVVGPGVRSLAGGMALGRDRVAVVTQEEVRRHWAGDLLASLTEAGVETECFTICDGEVAKSFTTAEDLARSMARWGVGRGDLVIALGGGVVGDVAGFVAATYQRGVDWVQVPTTLLAQVDASVGGKTGVNLPEGKNLVGAFHQPRGVLADIETLSTLHEREYRAGLGEVAKYGLLGDDLLLDLLLEHGGGDGGLARRDPVVLTSMVERSVIAKASVVEADERETTGLRATLNYGHTLAHAIETVGGYDMLHGEAVSIGLVFAASLATELALAEPPIVSQHVGLLEGLGLPTRMPATFRRADLLDVMRRDKKGRDRRLAFVLPGPNGFEVVHEPDEGAIVRALAAVGVER